MFEDFAQLVFDSNIGAVGASVDAMAYRAIKKEKPADFFIANADSNVFLFQPGLMSALDKIELVDKTGSLSIHIDDDRQHSFDYYKAYWHLKEMANHPKLPPHMKPRFERITKRVDQLCFSSDDFHPGIQAADMLAYVSRRFKQEPQFEADKERADFETFLFSLLTRGGTHRIQFYSEEKLRKLAGNSARSLRKARSEENCSGI